MKKWAFFFITVSGFLLFYCSFYTGKSWTEERVSIRERTEYYKRLYQQGTIDRHLVCTSLESYGKFVDEEIDALNKKLDQNRSLYNKLIDLPIIWRKRIVEPQITQDQEVNNYLEYLKENGLRIDSTEGGLFLLADPLYVVGNFKEYIPHDILYYYLVLYEDIEEGYAYDAVLVIPWDGLRGKIIRYEDFLKNLKADCPYLRNNAKEKIRRYLESYLYGLANGPDLWVGPDESMVVNPEAKESFEKFLKQNKDSKYYKVVKVYYNYLEKTNFRYDKSISYSYADRITELLEKSYNYY